MSTVRRRLTVRGVVQGVGFRPFVHGLALDLGLAGFVGNDGGGVFIEVEGEPAAVERFHQRLRRDAPPLAVIEDLEDSDVAVLGTTGFTIVESQPGAATGAVALVPPDVAMCEDCRREVLDPTDRRYRYPFTTCTSCGPRFTIIEGLPYDRPATTMAHFPLCPACAAEYEDPRDRRFHAQPLACPDCGPQLRLHGHDVADPLAEAVRLLASGRVVAIKGIGGFHLACDAADPEAVERLRAGKRRTGKPFAVMVPDVEAARRLAVVTDGEAAMLGSPPHPIVLLEARADHPVPALVAPGNGRVGVMLPYSPLHLLLFETEPRLTALVMTSGNLSDEPIVIDDDEAIERLGPVVDAVLLHDRPIARPCDDSVVRVLHGRELPVRRSRGWAPMPVRLPFAVPPLLAVGGELKATFCLASGRHAWLSQHIGDMGNLEALRSFERSVASLEKLYDVQPELLASDRHPDYLTARWAAERAATLGVAHERVQHHHAHVAALAAEHGLSPDEPMVAMAFDGTGYGDDGTIWGGEVLVGGYDGVERFAHLRPVPLPGGDAAIRHPARVALSHLRAAGLAWAPDLAAVAAVGPTGRRILGTQLERGLACVPTTSMGRLFDAVAAVLGVCTEATYEAQPAIELEAIARADAPGSYPFALTGGGITPIVIDPAPMWRALVDDLRAGTPGPAIAARFHRGVADVVVELAVRARARDGRSTVGLTGGVFQNVLLTEWCELGLVAAGFTVLTHRLVPPNDGGLALGQAVVAARRAARATSGQDRDQEEEEPCASASPAR